MRLYVGDMMFTGNDRKMFDDLKKTMIKEFEMADTRGVILTWSRGKVI